MKINQATTELDAIRTEDVFYVYFKNNGSASLSVNGSVTPKVFKAEDLPFENFIVTRVDYIMSQDEIIDLTKFGQLTSLTNGLLFGIGNLNFKTNGEIIMFATTSETSSIRIGGTTASIINGCWQVSDSFGNGIVTNKDDLTLTVRDDLSTIPYFEMAISGIKIN